MPTPDDKKRDQSPAPDAEDDDLELELEPPDAQVVAAEERRAKHAIEATKMAVDIDEIYRELHRDRGGEILEQWVRNFQFRFQVKHLLIATAVLSILLTLWQLDLFGPVLVFAVMISVAGLYLYLQWQEKKHRDEADRRRREMYARQRAQYQAVSGDRDPDDNQAATGDAAPKALEPLPNEVDLAWQAAMSQQKVRLRFSLREMLAAMTIAAVTFGLVHALGSPANAALLLGFIALVGLVIHAIGVEPPEFIVLGWWLILVLYVLLSIVAAIWSSFA